MQSHPNRFFFSFQFLKFIVLLPTFFLIFSSSIPASDNKPTVLNLIREDGLQKFYGFCRSVAADKIKCEFEGVRVILPAHPNEYKKRLDKLLSEIEKEAEVVSQKELSEILGGPKDICQDYKEMINRATKGEFEQNPLAGEIIKEDFKIKLNDICNQKPKSKKDAIKVFKQSMALMHNLIAAAEMRCCGLFWRTWKMEFTRISENKWANSPVPSGPCKIMKLYELEKESIKGIVDWSLTETRVAGDTESQECKDVEKELMKPTRWVHFGQQFIKLPCDYIDWSKMLSIDDW